MSKEKLKKDNMKHAIVIGGSISGLLAVHALSDCFEKVTLIERDTYPERPGIQKGIPQSAHLHLLLDKGQKLLEDFFPGIREELTAAGANYIDSAKDLAWYQQGVWKKRFESGLNMMLCSRGLLDWTIRKRIIELSGVELRTETTAANLIPSKDKSRITGIQIHPTRKRNQLEELRADLIVDASGRGSKTPYWLEEMGYGKPRETNIGLNLSYTTRLYRKPEDIETDWQFLVHYPKIPTGTRLGAIATIEGNLWMVGLQGYFQDQANPEEDEYLEFARSLPRPEIYEALKNASPLSEFRVHKVPSSRWRRYDRIKKFLDGLIVTGDATCSFNPIFAQGMTIAAQDAALLNAALKNEIKKNQGLSAGFAKRYQKKQSSLISLPWLMASILDFKYPRTVGKKPPAHVIFAWYTTQLLELSSTNEKVYHSFLEVMHMHRGLLNIMKPSVLIPLLGYVVKSIFLPLEKRAETGSIPLWSSLKKTAKWEREPTVR